MSPLVLLQLVGPAVALHTAETLHEAFPDRFGVSPGFEALVAAGKARASTRWVDGAPSSTPRSPRSGRRATAR